MIFYHLMQPLEVYTIYIIDIIVVGKYRDVPNDESDVVSVTHWPCEEAHHHHLPPHPHPLRPPVDLFSTPKKKKRVMEKLFFVK